MANFKNYIWLFPFIGAILIIISFFTPAVVFRSGIYNYLQYMDGFYLRLGGGSGPSHGLYFVPFILVIGIISTILIVIFTIILFFSALSNIGKEVPNSWMALGILLIGITIFYIGGSEAGYRVYRIIHGLVPISFWEVGTPGFAVIAPFIGGIISILAVIIGKNVNKTEVDISPINKKVPSISKDETLSKEDIYHPMPIRETQIAKFCPACGTKISNKEARYCPSCGHDLKK